MKRFALTALICVVSLGGCTDVDRITSPAPPDASASDADLWAWNGIGIATGDPEECDPETAIDCRPCPDEEQETLVAEYENPTFNNTERPRCADFEDDGGSAHFTWSELNGGWAEGNPHQPWGWINSILPQRLEETRTNYNRGGITLASGYRCPHGNAGLPGAAVNSRHTHGRAADMYSSSHSWTETEFNHLRTAAEQTNTLETSFWNTYTDHHYHAAW
ncbi:MAG: D-Ala-D-Ala carboxypeptidase family metallohydrolase [Longimicrobiales bacterium]